MTVIEVTGKDLEKNNTALFPGNLTSPSCCLPSYTSRSGRSNEAQACRLQTPVSMTPLPRGLDGDEQLNIPEYQPSAQPTPSTVQGGSWKPSM